MAKTRVCLLFGGVSEEYEVSIVSARSVFSHIDPARYDVTLIGITRQGDWRLFEGGVEELNAAWLEKAPKTALIPPVRCGEVWILSEQGVEKRPIDLVFPVMHGKNGEDGTLQGLLSLAGLPFVGCDCLSSALCMDKATAKLVLNNYGVPQAPCVTVEREEAAVKAEEIKQAAAALGYPLFVKPSASGSSCGVSKVNAPEGLADALAFAFASDKRVLIEKAIPGAEVEVAVLGKGELLVSPPGEIAPGSEFYDYDTKYKNDTARYYIPARLSPTAESTVRALAGKIYRALGCRGLARVDFFVDGETVVFNEINTLPGFTSISMYPKLMEAAGVSYSELIDRLIESAEV